MSLKVRDEGSNKFIMDFNESSNSLMIYEYEPTTFNMSEGEYNYGLTASYTIHTVAYGSFYDTTTQTNPTASTVNLISYNSTQHSNGVSIVDNTKITVETPGTYNLQFSAQVDKTDAGSDVIDIWFRKNGNDIPWSNTRLTSQGNNDKIVASWNYIDSLDGGDYMQIAWSSPDTDVRLYAEGTQSSPTRPAIPSVILTINKI
jgi:hypothetical protein